MSIEGLVSTTSIFHDKDGTAALKVVSLASSESYTSGKVAIITGTVASSEVFPVLTPAVMAQGTAYKDSAGNTVDLQSISGYVFVSDATAECRQGGQDVNVVSKDNIAARTATPSTDTSEGMVIRKIGGGSATWSLIVFGE
jgi:hypothetical protein